MEKWEKYIINNFANEEVETEDIKDIYLKI